MGPSLASLLFAALTTRRLHGDIALESMALHPSGPFRSMHGASHYDVAPDGRILVNVPLPELNVVLNWKDRL
jgi:hypothetical protein